MNKFKFSVISMIVAISSILMISCQKDDDKTPINNESIIGVWTLISYEISNFENSGNTVELSEDVLPRPTFNFDKHNKCHINNFDDDSDGVYVYEIIGDKIFFDDDITGGLEHSSFNYDITDNKLTLKRVDTYFHPNYVENTTVTLTK